MKTQRNILIAFILNLAFSIFELFGGVLTCSVAIMSDAVHDLGDAVSIGLSYFFEKKSKKQPDENYTYGYLRFSVLGGVITTLILIVGSVIVVCNAVSKIFNPTEIHYNGMIVFAFIGVVVNLCAAYFTHKGDSINQRAVNLHMLEDVLGWIVVLIGAVVMRFTGFVLIDPIMSVLVAVFILINAVKNLKKVVDIFLLKTPEGLSVQAIKEDVLKISGVLDVHHIHIWSMDGVNNYATMHIATNGENQALKHSICKELLKYKIVHLTIEKESEDNVCDSLNCVVSHSDPEAHHHHH